MKYYSYNNDFIFEFEGECQPSPLEPGKFLIPAQATSIKPPEEKEGFLQVFDQEKKCWMYIEISVTPEEPKPPEPTWDQLRRWAYMDESDPLLYEYLFDLEQKDKVEKKSKEVWLARVKEIKERFPKKTVTTIEGTKI